MAKDYFKSKGVLYKEVDVEHDIEKAKELVERTGQAGVPVIEIGDETILGFDRRRIDGALRANKLVA
jgi:glutaredoxin 3